jgi:hypothetical protein
VKTRIIPPVGEIIKNINIRNYREKMWFPIKKNTFSRHGGNFKPSPLRPVLQKKKFGNSAVRAPKNGPNNNGSYFCKHCGRNRTHDTAKCYFLKDKTQRFNGKTSDTNKEASQKERPFSLCTFRKEVNTLARKASKKGALGVYASALKRQQDKESKAKVAKRRAVENEDSSSSDDSMSVHNIEK